MRRVYFLATLAMLASFVSCTKADGPIDNLLGGKIRIIGHAGLGFESMLTPYPSNSLSSIRKVVEGENADGVEVDVQITKDSALVLLHDQTLESMTNCYGNVAGFTFAELDRCSYRTDFNSHVLQSEKIISLENIMARYAGSVFDPWIYLDIKFPIEEFSEPGMKSRFMRQVNKLVQQYTYAHHMSAAADNVEMLLYLRQLNPEIELHLDQSNFEVALQTATEHNLTGIVIANDHISKEQIKKAHEKGIQIVIFGVALRSDMVDAVNKHPDVIQTDNVNLLQQILSE
ncbi:MAG: glycerophosphodiester phosphodiesterase family protein [Sphingobacteriales bacterium]|nr:MAG: glycerophosphodiester phosphodiesterase family protein [Sphingobacteriales bacterium]